MSNIPPLNIFITARLKLKNKPNYIGCKYFIYLKMVEI